MIRLRRLIHSLRAARARQLRTRATRPIRRRRFPPATAGARFTPLGTAFWRSGAFASADAVAGEGTVRLLGKEFSYPPRGWTLQGEPRLRSFHLHYGDEILGWARRGDTAAARAGLDAWISGNPPRPGDAWHPYPLSTRAANWVAALSIAPDLATPAVVESLSRQLAHLRHNVEDDVLGNHLVRNARALVLGGLALEQDELVDRGSELLRREVPEQILSDGGHYERSPVYHQIVLRDLLDVQSAAELHQLDEPIDRMRVFAAALARPDGRPALFNDGALDLAPVLELTPHGDGLAVFPETGYAVARRHGVWLAFDCGPPGPSFLPAHAHADALSFQLWVDGRPKVVDPGAFTYEPGADRRWFRSTRAHSTIGLGGRDQFELWGAFRGGPLPSPALVSSDPLVAEVRLDGVRVRRCLTLGADWLEVDDELDGSGEIEVETSLPLGDGIAVELLADLQITSEDGWLSEEMLMRTPIRLLRARGRVRLPARLGWRIPLRP